MLSTRSRDPDAAPRSVASAAVHTSPVREKLARIGGARLLATLRNRSARVGSMVVGCVFAAALLEWAGWRITWRHGVGQPVLDAVWRAAFVGGMVRTLAGALGVGAGCMVATLIITAAVPRWRAVARRRAGTAFGVGVVAFLAFLGALVLWAP